MHAPFVCYKGRFTRNCQRLRRHRTCTRPGHRRIDHETTCSSVKCSTTDGLDGVRRAIGAISEAVRRHSGPEAGDDRDDTEHVEQDDDAQAASQTSQEHEVHDSDDAERILVAINDADEITVLRF
jgi:hypothetical protein